MDGKYTNLPDLFEAFFIVLVAFNVVCRLILCRLSSTLFKNRSTVLLSYLMSWTYLELSDIATTDLDFLTVFGLIGAFLGLAGVFLWLAKAFLGLPWPCPSCGVIWPLAPGFPDQKFQHGCSFTDSGGIPPFMCSYVQVPKAMHPIYLQDATLLGCMLSHKYSTKGRVQSKIKRGGGGSSLN